MKISLNELTTPDLLQLMRDVAAEIEVRVTAPEVRREKTVRPVIVMREPGDDDKEFCLHVAQKLRSGAYIKADERARVAQIAAEFAPWVRAQRLPTERGTGPWRKAAEVFSVGFAKER